MFLARELARQQGIETSFLAASQDEAASNSVEGFPIHRLAHRNSAELETVLNRIVPLGTPVLLHYVGYGYQKRGCPLWLLRGLERWRNSARTRKLVVMFHELFAFGPVWTSSFWLSLLQRHVVGSVARVADRCVTNMSMYANQLARFAPQHAGKIPVLPVFSNVGESEAVIPYEQRQPWLVLFGGGDWTKAAINRYGTSIERICGNLGCDRIVAIGSKSNLSWPGRLTFDEKGILPASEISAILNQARAGFIGYYPGYLGKSGIYAAYCAHGLVPIFPEANPSELDGIVRRSHYLTLEDFTSGDCTDTLHRVAAGAYRWYQDHSLRRTAEVMAGTLSRP